MAQWQRRCQQGDCSLFDPGTPHPALRAPEFGILKQVEGFRAGGCGVGKACARSGRSSAPRTNLKKLCSAWKQRLAETPVALRGILSALPGAFSRILTDPARGPAAPSAALGDTLNLSRPFPRLGL
jgi:hypothetical protein